MITAKFNNAPSKKFGSMIILFLMIFIVLVSLSCTSMQQSEVSLNDQLQSMSDAELGREKKRQEIMKLQIDNKNQRNFLNKFARFVPVITALIAVLGAIYTILKLINERKQDRQQRQVESRRRTDDRFTSIVTDLGSKSSSIQASAAVSLLTFLQPKYESFHNQVFLILLANLKIGHSPSIIRLLIESFEKAIRIRLQSVHEGKGHFGLDLSHCDLHRADLSGLNLKNADLGFTKLQSADLSESNLGRVRGWKARFDNALLTNANLEEARLKKAHFHGARFHNTRLVSAVLKETDLRKAKFFQSEMQSAHLEGADLKDANFRRANINDTFFYGAKFTDQTLLSILKLKTWRKAHFEKDIKDRLEELQDLQDNVIH